MHLTWRRIRPAATGLRPCCLFTEFTKSLHIFHLLLCSGYSPVKRASNCPEDLVYHCQNLLCQVSEAEQGTRGCERSLAKNLSCFSKSHLRHWGKSPIWMRHYTSGQEHNSLPLFPVKDSSPFIVCQQKCHSANPTPQPKTMPLFWISSCLVLKVKDFIIALSFLHVGA